MHSKGFVYCMTDTRIYIECAVYVLRNRTLQLSTLNNDFFQIISILGANDVKIKLILRVPKNVQIHTNKQLLFISYYRYLTKYF
jgi:hypothetical protein